MDSTIQDWIAWWKHLKWFILVVVLLSPILDTQLHGPSGLWCGRAPKSTDIIALDIIHYKAYSFQIHFLWSLVFTIRSNYQFKASKKDQ